MDFNRETNAEVNSLMEELNITGNYAALESYFLQKLFEIADNLNKTAIIWEDMFENGVDINSNDTVIQVWKDDYIGMMEKVCDFYCHLKLLLFFYIKMSNNRHNNWYN